MKVGRFRCNNFTKKKRIIVGNFKIEPIIELFDLSNVKVFNMIITKDFFLLRKLLTYLIRSILIMLGNKITSLWEYFRYIVKLI